MIFLKKIITKIGLKKHYKKMKHIIPELGTFIIPEEFKKLEDIISEDIGLKNLIREYKKGIEVDFEIYVSEEDSLYLFVEKRSSQILFLGGYNESGLRGIYLDMKLLPELINALIMIVKDRPDKLEKYLLDEKTLNNLVEQIDSVVYN